MANDRDTLVEGILREFSDAIDQRADADSDWHIERGHRAVAIDPDWEPGEDSNGFFVLHTLQSTSTEPGEETWSFTGSPLTGDAGEVRE